jgi:hypothetical protein
MVLRECNPAAWAGVLSASSKFFFREVIDSGGERKSAPLAEVRTRIRFR